MTVNIRHRGRRWSEDFPKNSYELLDLADIEAESFRLSKIHRYYAV